MSQFPWRTVLFISLAINLLAIGAVIGALSAGVRLQREAPAALVDRMPGPRAFMAALPPEVRAKVRRELVRSWAETRELRDAARQARRDAFTAADEEPYDAERVRAAFQRLRAADQAAIAVFHNNVIDVFAELTPSERREALSALRRAAPAARQSVVAPQEDADATVAPAAPDDARMLEERRRAWRERRRQHLERGGP